MIQSLWMIQINKHDYIKNIMENIAIEYQYDDYGVIPYDDDIEDEDKILLRLSKKELKEMLVHKMKHINRFYMLLKLAINKLDSIEFVAKEKYPSELSYHNISNCIIIE